jgi:hypothetical protein
LLFPKYPNWENGRGLLKEQGFKDMNDIEQEEEEEEEGEYNTII